MPQQEESSSNFVLREECRTMHFIAMGISPDYFCWIQRKNPVMAYDGTAFGEGLSDGELLRFAVCPDEGVGIEEELHGCPSQNSSDNGSSKSPLTTQAPGCRPSPTFYTRDIDSLRFSDLLGF